MNPALDIHRLQFAFTATFHYIFPQLTMGLALLLLILKTLALRTGNAHYDRALRFWARIFAINFAIGVVTGIPLEFEFGTNWAVFSRSAGSVIGQTARDGGHLFFFPRVQFSRTAALWRAPPWTDRPLGGGFSGLAGLLAFRIFHRGHKCVDAASRWLHAWGPMAGFC